MFGLRYKPWFMTAWKSVRSGMIGDIRMLNAQKSYKLGLRQEFFKHRNTYGGTIPWVGSHAIDWVYWFSGEKFRSVYATHSRKYNKDHGELEVTALCHFTLTNEIFASVSVDYLRPEQAPTHDDDRLRVVGTKGIIEVREHKVFLINGECSGIKELPLLPEEEIFDFLKQAKGQGECLVSAEESFYITEACLRARQSADEGKVLFSRRILP